MISLKIFKVCNLGVSLVFYVLAYNSKVTAGDEDLRDLSHRCFSNSLQTNSKTRLFIC